MKREGSKNKRKNKKKKNSRKTKQTGLNRTFVYSIEVRERLEHVFIYIATYIYICIRCVVSQKIIK